MHQFEKSLRYRHRLKAPKPTLSPQGLTCIFIGILVGFSLATILRTKLLECLSESTRLSSQTQNQTFSESLNKIYTHIEPQKSLVFIGVMTAQKYLDTRAKAVYETWGRFIPGKMSFFSRAGSTAQFSIPLVSLNGVDDSYPPQKKSFMMLKFMHDNYIDKFEWFMRVDDDVYIKPDKLEHFLRSLNSSKPQFIGQAGLGNKDEFGLLSLDYDENFCMGGPGIIMSRETLKRVVPNISDCLKNLYSTHEDVEIGRCVRKYANTSCTWSYEMQHIFHHNSSGNQAFTRELLSKDVLRAISLHPIKLYQHQYRVHNFFNQRKLVDLRQKILRLEREIYQFNRDLSGNSTVSRLKRHDRFLQQPSFTNLHIPTKREKRHDYTFFSRSVYSASYISPKHGIESYWKKAMSDAMRQIMDDINKDSIKRGRIIDFKDYLYGYYRHMPSLGIDYIIDSLLVYRKYEGRKMTVQVRRHAYVRQTYTDMIYREDTNMNGIYYQHGIELHSSKNNHFNLTQNNTLDGRNYSRDETFVGNIVDFIMPPFKRERHLVRDTGENLLEKKINNEKLTNSSDLDDVFSKIIHFVVPLAGRLDIFRRFMRNFEQICLENRENVKLAVVLYVEENDASANEQVELIVNELQGKYPSNDLRIVEAKGRFSRSIACEIGASLYTSQALVFFVDVDILFNRESLMRIRLNTIETLQVYYPIVFSEYDPRAELLNETHVIEDYENHFSFNSDKGYWRQFGFGIVAAYNSDLRSVGGFNTSIVGWGKEDVDLYEKFVSSNVTVFRAIDPGLVHIFHKIECDPNLAKEQMIMCVGSKSTSIASQRLLANLIYKHKLYNFKIPKEQKQ